MKVTARGWRRDCGENVITTMDLDNGYEDYAAASTLKAGTIYMRRKNNGDLDLMIGPNTVTLGGKYQIIITHSKDDIMSLFAEAYKDEPLSDVVNKLSEALKAIY